jgi:hypothetical protein
MIPHQGDSSAGGAAAFVVYAKGRMLKVLNLRTDSTTPRAVILTRAA